MNSQVVHAIFQRTGIPYGYVETVSKSAKATPKSYFEDSGFLTLDKWKVEQAKTALSISLSSIYKKVSY